MPKTPKPTNSLLSALEFLEPIMEKEGNANQTHVILHNNFAVGFDGKIAIGHPIEENFSVCASFLNLKAAIKKIGKQFSITLNPNLSLTIANQKLKVIVPCIEYYQMMITAFDPAILTANDLLKKGFEKLAWLIDDKSERLITSSLCLEYNTMITTNGQLFLQFWHSLPLPTMALSKEFCSITAKIKADIVSIGYSHNSLTFHFANGAWIKTLLREGKWPDISSITGLGLSRPVAVPVELMEAVEAVLPHSGDGAVYVSPGTVRSHHADQGETGATYRIENQAEGIYNGKLLIEVLKEAKQIQFDIERGNDKILGFTGEGVRGFLMPRRR